jgi:hypothetical protein
MPGSKRKATTNDKYGYLDNLWGKKRTRDEDQENRDSNIHKRLRRGIEATHK